MPIRTPENAIKFDDLTLVQKTKIQNDFGVGEGKVRFSSVKTTLDHAINIQTLEDGKVYIVKNDDIIEIGNTISDGDANSFPVQLVGSDYIPSGWYYSVSIEGSEAVIKVSLEVPEVGMVSFKLG
jgi:hypothetical protein